MAMMLVCIPFTLAALEVDYDKTEVVQGGALTITFHETAGESYGVVFDVPNGWLNNDLSPDGKYRTYVDSGDDTTLVLTAPSYDQTFSFGGEYFIFPQTDYSQFPTKTITTGAGGNGNGGTTTTTDSDSNLFLYVGIGIAALIVFSLMGKKR